MSAAHAVDVEARLYDRHFFNARTPAKAARRRLPPTQMNPKSLSIVKAKAEPALATAKPGEHYQLERVGFFVVDEDTKSGGVVLNRTVQLKDSWQKQVATPAPASKRTPPAQPQPKKAEHVIELSPEAIALRDAHGISGDAARTIAMEPALGPLFEAAVKADPGSAKTVATLLANDVLGELRAKRLDRVPFDGGALVELAGLVKDGTISSAQTKEVLAAMFAAGGKSPKAVVAEKGLAQIANAEKHALSLPIVDGRSSPSNADTVRSLQSRQPQRLWRARRHGDEEERRPREREAREGAARAEARLKVTITVAAVLAGAVALAACSVISADDYVCGAHCAAATADAGPTLDSGPGTTDGATSLVPLADGGETDIGNGDGHFGDKTVSGDEINW